MYNKGHKVRYFVVALPDSLLYKDIKIF